MSPGRIVTCAAVVVVTTAAGCGAEPGERGGDAPPGATPSPGPAPSPSPGDDGIGDPYYPLDGNGGYEVGHYDLDLRYDPGTDELSGTARIEAVAERALSAFNLDLQGLEVSAVEVDGAGAQWTRDGGELTVTPAGAIADGAAFEVTVAYAGVPGTVEDTLGSAGFVHTDDGALVAGQPDVAATWFPANDHPRDAATVAVAVAVPEGLEAVSNGRLEGTTTEGGWTTWRWRAREPMAPYLVVLAVGEFDLREYTADGIAYWDAYDPDLFALPPGSGADRDGTGTVGATAEAALGRQPEIIAFLAGLFGPYPFDVAGGIVDDVEGMGFALETQTRPVYSPVFFSGPGSGEGVVVHELAHQWFGDDVRLAGWQHIWLNEGIATYAEWLWEEESGGPTAQQQFDRLMALPASAALWSPPPGDPGPAVEELFSPAVYFRGALTHHALRTELGDEDYFGLLREWASSRSGEAVTTEEFVALAEDVAGRDLGDFFEAWLFTEGPPDAPG